MSEEELQQQLQQMQAAGLNPQLCDTPVPLLDMPVLAGNPTEIGDAQVEDYVLVPKSLVGSHPVFLIDAEGLSMRDADIMPGDRLEVQMEPVLADGDIVVAGLDGAFTVKTLFTDDEGLLWLVPRNDSYDPILLSGSHWHIVGKVIGLRKGVPRTPYGDCAKAVMRMRRKTAAQQPKVLPPADDQPTNLVFRQFHQRHRIDFAAVRKQVERVVVMQMKHRYEWYAAYRVLMDLKLLDDLKLTRFAQQMQAWFPDVPLQCTADSLGEYAVGHTSKVFALWDADKFRQEQRKGQSMTAFTTLYHRCEELRAALFPLPVVELALPL